MKEFEVPRLIFCRQCFPDVPENVDAGINAHIIKTWISGEDGTDTFELDGRTSKTMMYPGFLPPLTNRGSTITILFQGEGCLHLWIRQISFHKGDVCEVDIPITDEAYRLFYMEYCPLKEMDRS